MSCNDTPLKPTIITVPCFSGAPWVLEPLTGFQDFTVRTMRLPEAKHSVGEYAVFVAHQVADVEGYVLVGDSFGAAISLELALRHPRGLAGLVLSGGFAANPLPSWKSSAAGAARWAPGALYRQAILRFHAAQLASKFDATAEVPHTEEDYRALFVANTPRESYAARVLSVSSFDVRAQLKEVTVPTLVLTPEDDHLVGRAATDDLVAGLAQGREEILPGTGHMFRFTHPSAYSAAIETFINEDVPPIASPS